MTYKIRLDLTAVALLIRSTVTDAPHSHKISPAVYRFFDIPRWQI